MKLGPVKRFGRFTLVKKLATGGMAEIWLARQTGLAGFNRFVVIKKILSHLAEEETFVKMFLDEARMSSQLTHPNIVQVYDLGEASTTYFIAMEYIAGENLAAIAWRGVKRRSPLSPPFAARIIADSCKALHYAHHLRGSDGKPLQIVHRDISPQNILVTYEGEVKVVDFGIAKAATKSQHTRTGMLKGKFSYMSPEQCLGNPVDMRSDVFALGIVLYELCTGKRLFKHESELMILEMITKRRITPPSDVANNIAPGLEAIILKALEKDKEARYDTAQDMQIALEDYLRTERGASTNADIATFMRDLFVDKMEEKRRLCELASNDEVLAQYFTDEEATEEVSPQGTRRKVVYGGRPSDIRVSGVQHNAMTGTAQQQQMLMQHSQGAHPMPGYPMGTPAGMTPTSFPPGMYHPGMSAPGMPGYPSHSGGIMLPTGQVQETSNWGPRIIIALALLVIIFASAYLYYELTRVEAAPPPPPPAKEGFLQIDSVPDGATIYVDGKGVKLENGRDAVTPIEQLTPLKYGTTYTIRIVKDGYHPYVESVVMGEKVDGKLIKPSLERIPAKVIIEVSGEPRDTDVEIFLDGELQGIGRRIEKSLNPGTVEVKARAEGYKCTPKPAEKLTLQPGKTEWVTIRCEKVRRVSSGRGTRPSGSHSGGGRTVRPSGNACKSGCCVDTTQPPGEVTIATRPYAEIYSSGKKIGETPLNKHKLAAGCHHLELRHPPTGFKMKIKIKVEPNKNLRYRYTSWTDPASKP